MKFILLMLALGLAACDPHCGQECVETQRVYVDATCDVQMCTFVGQIPPAEIVPAHAEDICVYWRHVK